MVACPRMPVLKLRRFKMTVCNYLISLCVGSCVGVLRRLRRLVISHWEHCASVLRRFCVGSPPIPPIGRTAPFGVGRTPFGDGFEKP